MIDQLISMVTQKLGIGQDVAEKAVGVLMGLIKKDGDGGAVGALFDNVPGAADLADRFGGESASSGGGLLGAVGGMLGGGAGDALESLGALKDTGLSMDQVGEMMPVVKGFLEENAGADAVQNALGSIPALKNFLG